MTHDLTENDLLEKIGMELAERDMLIAPPSKEELLEKGKRWFDKNYSELVKAICSNDIINPYSNCSETDTDTILAAIADLISSICIGVSPFTVAQLLMKRGLKVLCKDYWNRRFSRELSPKV